MLFFRLINSHLIPHFIFGFSFFRSDAYLHIYPNSITYYLNDNIIFVSLNFLLYVKLLEVSYFIKFKLCLSLSLSLSLSPVFSFPYSVFLARYSPIPKYFFLRTQSTSKKLHFWNNWKCETYLHLNLKKYLRTQYSSFNDIFLYMLRIRIEMFAKWLDCNL
jgi:hypothetical protein